MTDFEKILQTTNALADGNRLRIIAALLKYNELCACQITEFLGIAGATASRHLAILVNAALLQSRKDGRWVYYRLNNDDSRFWTWLNDDLYDKADLGCLDKIVASPVEDICRKQRGIKCCPINNK